MSKPVSVLDVAEYILRKQGEMSTWKLQKLCYYAQAWSLVWDEEPLFAEKIEAWANGPVVRELYKCQRGQFRVSSAHPGDPANLSKDQCETVDAVLEEYGAMTGASLSGRTHQERPWFQTRQDAKLKPSERGNAEISHDIMADCYRKVYEG